MKYFLLLFLTLRAWGSLKDLKTVKSCDGNSILTDDAQSLFVVPYYDDQDYGKIYIIKTPSQEELKKPIESQITAQDIATTESKVCIVDNPGFDATKLEGKIYLVNPGFESISVYQWIKDYSVTSSLEYILIFAKNTTRASSIKNIILKESTKFVLYSGLPDDENKIALYTYSPELALEELYVQDEYFHIQFDHTKAEASLSFDVSEVEESGPKTTFTTSGFIVSPNFPNGVTGEYTNPVIIVEKKPSDRSITFQITTASENTNPPEEEIELDLSNAGVTVSLGHSSISVPPGVPSIRSTTVLPANTDSFQIAATVGYAISFIIKDDLTTTTTESYTTTPSVSCPPATEKPVTCPTVTCPTTIVSSTPCPCATSPTTTTSTTTIPTTTQSAKSASVITAFSALFIHNLL